jgi:hypothetical protein
MKSATTFKPIVLADGRSIGSLDQVRNFIASLPEIVVAEAHWKYAGDLLLRAVDRHERYATADARAQMTRALRIGGFV